ncbi:NAD(P)-dependent oxidoreductase [Micromonospora sp. NPDC050187]|uniref:NAD(P)-dependent oxidoreductase n=1 Tax=Micromonospora sp. NPDC050187 TaxID=3364277 RepID=UPI0037B5D480
MAARKVAVLGLGGMGGGMAHRLLSSGVELTVWNRTAAKAAGLVAAGARQADSPAEAVAEADVVLVSLADEDAVEQVLFGAVCRAARPGTPIVDTSTVSPTYAREAGERAARAGVKRIEACVIGNPHQARNGELRVLTAGAQEDLAEVGDLLALLGPQVVHLGPPGMAATMKLVFNAMLGAQVASMAEAIAYGERSGLNRDMLLRAVEHSGFSSKVMSFRAALMRERKYEPAAFRTRLMNKDLRLALAEAAKVGVDMPVIERSAVTFTEAIDAGYGDQDAAAVHEMLSRPDA